MNHTLPELKFKLLLLVSSLLVYQGILTPGLHGQESVPLDSLLSRVQAIPMAEISLEVTSINSTLVEKRKILLTEEEKVRIESNVDSVLARYDVIMEDPRHKKFDEINSRELQSLNNEWGNVSVRLEQIQKDMTSRVETFENEKTSLQIPLRQWNLTLEQARNENATQTVLDQIRSTVSVIEKIIADLNQDAAFLQDDLVKVSEKLISSNEIIQTFDVMLDESTIQRFRFDKPVIWKDSLYVRDTARAEPGYFGANMPAIKGFVADNSRKMMVHLALFILITIILISMFRRLQKNIDKKDEKYVSRTRILMSKPFATSLMITFTITLIYYDNIPQVIRSLNAILILVPMTLLIAHNIHHSIKKYIYLLMVVILLIVLHDLTYREDLFSRLIMLVVYTISFISVISMIRDSSIQELARGTISRRALYNLLYVVGLMMGIAIIANISGGVYIAEYFGASTLYSIVLAVLIYSFIQVIDGILIMIIYSKGISSLTVIKDFGPTVEKRLTGLVALAGWTIWILTVLQEFTIRDEVFAWFNKVFVTPINIGSTQISLLNIILFFFIIWLTISISRIIRFFLEGDVFTRLKLKKGVPGAISLMLRIIIITIGFLIAIAAAGVQMEKLAILLGAFGVGIGFGLQNIFNNLISGIILAFERPINEGDIIEVGELMGIVKEIGIRSSIIKTYDGSEVIVPNGNLISNELINWTLSDQRRRGEVRIGVAYGTDPQPVLDLLLEAAESNERVLDYPKPWAIFLGFGESSLDFRLLFWIADADTRLTIQSEVTVKVNQMIKEAGIEIPFPQRDLHLRSADAKIFDRINAVDESIAKKTGEKFPKAGKQKKDPGEEAP
jgi:small-conductance mechanosensitive channel